MWSHVWSRPRARSRIGTGRTRHRTARPAFDFHSTTTSSFNTRRTTEKSLFALSPALSSEGTTFLCTVAMTPSGARVALIPSLLDPSSLLAWRIEFTTYALMPRLVVCPFDLARHEKGDFHSTSLGKTRTMPHFGHECNPRTLPRVLHFVESANLHRRFCGSKDEDNCQPYIDPIAIIVPVPLKKRLFATFVSGRTLTQNIDECNVHASVLASDVRKRLHMKQRQTPPPQQSKIYTCSKCGLPKRGHICVERTIDALQPNALYEFLALANTPPASDACDICGKECVATDSLDGLLDGFAHCIKCKRVSVHFTCMPDMLAEYVCSKCIV